MIGNGRTADFLHDMWLSDLSSSRWFTFVNPEVKSIWYSDLIQLEGSGWRSDQVAQIFGPELTKRVLSIAIPTHSAEGVRVWRSCEQKVSTGDLYMMYYETPTRKLDVV